MLESPAASLSVSVIIATKNREASLIRAIHTIADQATLPLEVIIVDQTPAPGDVGDRIRVLLPTLVGLNYIWDPRISGLATARNRAIDCASGNILLFIDDDVTLRPDYVANLIAAYAQLPEATGVSGVPDNYPRAALSYRIWSAIFMRGPFFDDRQPAYWNAAKLSQPVAVSRMTGAMMSFRSDDLDGVRFDRNLRGVSDGEDVDFCIRLGRRYFLYPQCKLTHHFSVIGRESDHWTRRHARSNAYLYFRNWRKHKILFSWLRLGLYIAAIAACVSRASLSPLEALRGGITEGRRCGGFEI